MTRRPTDAIRDGANRAIARDMAAHYTPEELHLGMMFAADSAHKGAQWLTSFERFARAWLIATERRPS